MIKSRCDYELMEDSTKSRWPLVVPGQCKCHVHSSLTPRGTKNRSRSKDNISGDAKEGLAFD